VRALGDVKSQLFSMYRGGLEWYGPSPAQATAAGGHRVMVRTCQCGRADAGELFQPVFHHGFNPTDERWTMTRDHCTPLTVNHHGPPRHLPTAHYDLWLLLVFLALLLCPSSHSYRCLLDHIDASQTMAPASSCEEDTASSYRQPCWIKDCTGRRRVVARRSLTALLMRSIAPYSSVVRAAASRRPPAERVRDGSVLTSVFSWSSSRISQPLDNRSGPVLKDWCWHPALSYAH